MKNGPPPRDQVHGGFSNYTMRAPTKADHDKDRYIRELHAMVPPKASLAIGESEMTHVSHLDIKGLRDSIDADYILYSLGSGGDRALVSGDFDKIAERPGGLMLLKRKTARLQPILPPGSPPAGAGAPAGPRPCSGPASASASRPA